MSLVKKFKPGGKFDIDSYNNEANSILGGMALKSKDEKAIRERLAQIRDADISGTTQFSGDSLAQTYSVTGDKHENYQGSPDAIKTNPFTGRMRVQDDQDLNSIAMRIHLQAKNNILGSSSSTPTKQKLGFGDFKTYMVEKAYGTPQGFETEFLGLKKDEDRQKAVLTNLNTYVDNYLSDVEKNKDWAEYSDLPKVQALKTALQSGDYDAIKKSGYPLLFNLDEYKISDDERTKFVEKEKQQQAAVTAQETEAFNKGFKSDYLTKGFSPTFLDNLISKGFKPSTLKVSTFDPTLTNDYITKQGGYVFESPTGSQIIVKADGTLLEEKGINFDQFNPLHGLAWTQKNGYFEPIQSQWKQENKGEKIGLKGTVGNSSDFIIEGVADDPNNPDYTKHLIIKNPDGSFYSEVFKKEDGKYYSKNNQQYQINLIGYGDVVPPTYNPREQFSDFYNSSIILPTSYDYAKDFASIQRVLAEGYSTRPTSAERLAATRLTTALGTPDAIINQTSWNNVYRLLDRFSRTIRGGISPEPISKQGPTPLIKRSGGILFAQQGNPIQERLDWLKVQKQSSITSVKNQKVINHGNITNTWAGQSTGENLMDAASIGLGVLSMAPGVAGAIGAGGMFAADLAKDLTDGDGNIEWGTHALNLAFIGLSTLGLGFAKTLVKAGKVAKEGVDFANAASKANKYKDLLGLGAKEVAGIEKVAEIAKTGKFKSVEEIANYVKTSKTLNVEEQKIITKALEQVSQIKVPSTLTRVTGLNVGKVGNAVMKGATNPWVTTAAKTAFVLPAVGSVGRIGEALIKEGPEGLKYTNPDDWQSVAMAGAMGKNMWRDYVGKRALTRQLIPVTDGETKTTIKLGDTEYKLNELLSVPEKEVKSKLKVFEFGKTKTARETKNAESVTKFKEELLKKLNATEQGKNLTAADLEKLNIYDKKQFITSSPRLTGEKTLPTEVQATTKNLYQDNKDYQRAKELWENKSVWTKMFAPITHRAELKELANTPISKTSTITNKMLKKDIAELEKTLKKTQGVYPINKKVLPKRKLQLEEYKAKRKTILNQKQGGILKAQAGINTDIMGPMPLVGSTVPFDPSIIASNLSSNQNVDKKVDPRYKGNKYWESPEAYKTVWLPAVDKAFADPKILRELDYQTRNYRGQDWEDVQRFYNAATTPEAKKQLMYRLATDGKVGPYHELVKNVIEPPPGITMPPLKNGPPQVIVPPTQTGPPEKTTGNFDVPPATKKSFDWTVITDPIPDVVNFLDTINTNNKVSRLYDQALNAGLFQLPYMPHTYLRVDKPYSLFANELAGETRSRAWKAALATSDLNAANAIRLQGEANANEIMGKATQNELARMDQIRGQQLENDSRIDLANNNVLGQNRQLFAGTANKIFLNHANTELAQRQARDTFIKTMDRNARIGKYKIEKNQLWNMMNDPNLKNLTDKYNNLAGEEGYNEAKALYEQRKIAANGNPTFPATFEESQEYINWQNRVKAMAKSWQRSTEPLRYKQSQMQFNSDIRFSKEGSKLSKQDYIDIENAKYNNTRKLKSTELFYHSIFKNNEMLQKALIRIFK